MNKKEVDFCQLLFYVGNRKYKNKVLKTKS